jgi:two-component system KDP operon response regulator KdpE
MQEIRITSPGVVVIEDEPQIRRFLRTALETEGCAVVEAGTALQGLVEAGTRKPDLIVLDLGLPDRDGVEVVREVRAWSTVPILILSARSGESDKVAALDAGADDYLTKPFGVGELLARVRALLRRKRIAGTEEPQVTFGNVVVDLARRRVTRAGRDVHLTPIEYRLLTLLIANAGRVLTHRQLLREIWGPSHGADTHYLRVYSRLP